MKTEFLGLSVVEEATIKCGDCATPLALIVISETNGHRSQRGLAPLKSQYRVTGCPKCGGSSFVSKVFEGTTNICSTKETLILDTVDTDINNGIIVSVLTIRNKK